MDLAQKLMQAYNEQHGHKPNTRDTSDLEKMRHIAQQQFGQNPTVNSLLSMFGGKDEDEFNRPQQGPYTDPQQEYAGQYGGQHELQGGQYNQGGDREQYNQGGDRGGGIMGTIQSALGGGSRRGEDGREGRHGENTDGSGDTGGIMDSIKDAIGGGNRRDDGPQEFEGPPPGFMGQLMGLFEEREGHAYRGQPDQFQKLVQLARGSMGSNVEQALLKHWVNSKLGL